MLNIVNAEQSPTHRLTRVTDYLLEQLLEIQAVEADVAQYEVR